MSLGQADDRGHRGEEGIVEMTDNPFDPIPAPPALFRDIINGLIATGCFAATAAVVLALIEVFAP